MSGNREGVGKILETYPRQRWLVYKTGYKLDERRGIKNESKVLVSRVERGSHPSTEPRKEGVLPQVKGTRSGWRCTWEFLKPWHLKQEAFDNCPLCTT